MLQPKGEFSWMLFVPTILLLGISLFFILRNLTFILASERTEGIVTGNDPTTLREQVEFKTKEGKIVTTSSRTESSNGLRTGERVTVYYSANNPEGEARIATFRDLWLGPVILGVIGFLFFIMWFGTWVGPPDHPRSETIQKKTSSPS